MAKNLIPQIAKMLGVELGEEFKINEYDEITFKFAENGIMSRFNEEGAEWTTTYATLNKLLRGEIEIVKLPWKPNMGEEYYTFSTSAGKWIVCQQLWANHPFDLALFDKDWVFHSKKEAEAALPKMAAEFGMEYKL